MDLGTRAESGGRPRTGKVRRRIAGGQRRRRQPAGGSATVEFCIIVPFIIILTAAIWDMREYISRYTDLVRESYVVIEAMANQFEGNTPPFQSVLRTRPPEGPFGRRLVDASVAGTMSAAVVARGTTHRDGTACADDAWCPPEVLSAWPPTENERVWPPGPRTGCTEPNALPGVGTSFAATATVLPGEDADGALEETWVSRNMSAEEWWIVVDICIQPRPGVFTGAFTNYAVETLNLPFDLNRRFAWPSVHDRGDCEWCDLPPPPP